jgi:aspartate aminotransferase-like enzyme
MLIVDAISAFITDDIDMSRFHAAAIITGSQKALAVQPGIAVVALAPEAIERIEKNQEICMYLSLKNALLNMKRGQTPFTPAVTILLQINTRLKEIDKRGGLEKESKSIREITEYFRKRISNYPFEFVVKEEKDRSKAVTALHPTTCGAKKIISILKDEYGIWGCPNGGDLADEIFRIGHIGHITKDDYDILFKAFDDMQNRNII